MFRTEYSRILEFYLYEEIRFLHQKDTKPNPFQSAQFPIPFQLKVLVFSVMSRAPGGKRTFIGALILGLVDELCSEACWYSEASCGW